MGQNPSFLVTKIAGNIFQLDAEMLIPQKML